MNDDKDKVLIVDDSRTMRLLLRQALESFNYHVHEAESGEQGLEFFPLVKPDVVLLDVEMPGINGFETCLALRKLPQGKHVPILITTTLDNVEAINRAYEVNATDFITKPINWDLIGHRVKYIIRTSRDYLELQTSKQDLQRTQQELEQLNAGLEQRVAESTAKLRETNLELSTTLEALKSAQEQLITSEKMATFGKLVSGIANEFKVPIENCLSQVASLQQILEPILVDFKNNTLKRSILENFLGNSDRAVQAIRLNLQRTVNLITSFKQISIDQAVEPRRKFVLKDYLAEILFSLKSALNEKNVEVVVHCPETLTVDGYPGSLFRSMTILIMNSLIHGFEHKDSGTITIYITADPLDVNIQYSDNGKGISPENLSRIFEPFYTTKAESGFVGLGLHIAYNQITQVLGGSMTCESVLGAGVTFNIRFPLVAK